MISPAPGSTPDAPACLIAVKGVPGASRDQIAGVLELPDGPRLKIRIAAPPESGKANKAIIALLARTLGVARRSVTLERGQTVPLKVFRIEGLSADDAGSLISENQ